jgi:hypothetical protein
MIAVLEKYFQRFPNDAASTVKEAQANNARIASLGASLSILR